VATFHDLFVLTGEYSTVEFRARFAEQARRAAAGSQAIITVSAFTKSQVVSLLGVDPVQVHVVHHGSRNLVYPKGLAREKIILNVGAIQKRKNIARLVEAFETVDSSWRLVLAGSEEILARIAKSPACDRIGVLGYVAPHELAGWYARASVFAFPSLDEGFGMPLLEAMSAGTPVLASNSSAMPEVAGDAALLVDPEDVAGLAQRLRDLTERPELRKEMAVRGLQRASLFTWENAVRQTWAVYRKILA
jgi:glycosyltransferase involved in cell wall biosynthesis